jgi:hypothetical protein
MVWSFIVASGNAAGGAGFGPDICGGRHEIKAGWRSLNVTAGGMVRPVFEVAATTTESAPRPKSPTAA